jgi:hypothetical protein
LTASGGLRLVVASRFDLDAIRAVSSWGADAAVLSPDDLSSSGWIHRPGRPDLSRAMVGGRSVPYAQIGGIWALLDAVSPSELGHIVPGDRGYVASEMTGFLRAFLAALPGRVVNREALRSVKWWTDEVWRWQAERLGFGCGDPPTAIESGLRQVTVVGRRALGSRDPEGIAAGLAAGLGLDLLAVRLRGNLIVAASTRPPFNPAVVREIGRYLSTPK